MTLWNWEVPVSQGILDETDSRTNNAREDEETDSPSHPLHRENK